MQEELIMHFGTFTAKERSIIDELCRDLWPGHVDIPLKESRKSLIEQWGRDAEKIVAIVIGSTYLQSVIAKNYQAMKPNRKCEIVIVLQNGEDRHLHYSKSNWPDFFIDGRTGKITVAELEVRGFNAWSPKKQ